MKHFTFSLLAILLSFNLFSQNSNLIVFSENGEEFIMTLNGVQQNENFQTRVKATNLNADTYKVSLDFNNKSIPRLTKTIWFETMGMEYTFSLTMKKNGTYTLRPVSQTALKSGSSASTQVTENKYETPEPREQTTPNSNTENINISMGVSESEMDVNVDDSNEEINTSVNFDIHENGSSEVSHTTTVTSSTNMPDGPGMDVNMEIDDENDAVNINVNLNGIETTTTTTTTTSTGSGNDDYGIESEENSTVTTLTTSGNCEFPISNSEFESIFASISDKDFEDTQLKTAKQIAKAKCLKSIQIKEIMDIFDFDDSKLDFAKYAYEYVFDPDNYYQVNDSFEFESSIEDLQDFIGE
jgi:hypothetical protein